MFPQLCWLQHFSARHVRAHLEALATEVAAAMARLAIATTAAAKADRRSSGGNGGAGAVWPVVRSMARTPFLRDEQELLR